MQSVPENLHNSKITALRSTGFSAERKAFFVSIFKFAQLLRFSRNISYISCA